MNTDKKLWRNRKAKKELARRLQSENPGLEVVHPNAAESMWATKLTTWRCARTVIRNQCVASSVSQRIYIA